MDFLLLKLFGVEVRLKLSYLKYKEKKNVKSILINHVFQSIVKYLEFLLTLILLFSSKGHPQRISDF